MYSVGDADRQVVLVLTFGVQRFGDDDRPLVRTDVEVVVVVSAAQRVEEFVAVLKRNKILFKLIKKS